MAVSAPGGGAAGGAPRGVVAAAGGGSSGGREASRGHAVTSPAAASAAPAHATFPQRMRSRSGSWSVGSGPTPTLAERRAKPAPAGGPLLWSGAAMAAETPVYDLTVLLDADAPSERRAEILGAVEGAIANGGEIVSKHDWGVRNLAYEIDHHKDAEYHLIQLTGPPELLDRLRTALRVTDGVLRHRIIRLPSGMPPPPSLRPEPRAAEPAAAAEAAPPAEARQLAARPAPSRPRPPSRAPAAPPAEEPAPEAPRPPRRPPHPEPRRSHRLRHAIATTPRNVRGLRQRRRGRLYTRFTFAARPCGRARHRTSARKEPLTWQPPTSTESS